MRRPIGNAILTLSGSGFPLTQLVIRRFGWRGALVAEGVAVGLLVRDIAMIGMGAPKRLARGPASLLWLEAGVAGAAVVSGAVLLRDREATAARIEGWRVPRAEFVRRVAMGALFGIHTWRLRIYLGPGSGRRVAQTGSASAEAVTPADWLAD